MLVIVTAACSNSRSISALDGLSLRLELFRGVEGEEAGPEEDNDIIDTTRV